MIGSEGQDGIDLFEVRKVPWGSVMVVFKEIEEVCIVLRLGRWGEI